MQEVWRPVAGYEGLYEVSSLGRVRACTLSKHRRKTSKSRLMKASKHRYWSVCLRKNGRKKTLLVHKLVAEAFLGARPHNLVICHGPGGVDDNSVTNLRYDTQAGNLADRAQDGTHRQRGSSHTRAKLNEEQVLQIRKLLRGGATQTELALQFGVSNSLIWRIDKRLLWAHI